MSAEPRAILLALSTLAGTARASQIVQPQGEPLPTAPYAELTNDLAEFTNFHPEPFAGIALDGEAILAVNPYNNTWVRYAGPSATEMDLQVLTGHNPVSIGVWNEQVIVVCTGSHAAFVHARASGEILDVVQLDSEPADMVIDHESGRAFVSCRGDNTVVEINLTNKRLVRYPIGCGQRPGPLFLDPGDPQDAGDELVYVAPMVTGNNSVFVGGAPVGSVADLEEEDWGLLPDEDVFRIDPSKPVADAVEPVVKNAGSLIFGLGRNPAGAQGNLWILSTDSNNKGELDTEPELQGKTVINQLKIVALDPDDWISAGPGIDLDDLAPGGVDPTYVAARSVNQARALAFQADGDAFVASPMSRVIARLEPDGTRSAEFRLPRRAQCYAVEVYDDDTVLALCLGTMTIEVFTEGSAEPGRPLPLGNDPTPGHVREGRDLMLDGLISADGRSSCFACHEGGRSDQLGWPIAGAPTDLKDVMVTQSLLSIDDTFPHHWRGERDLSDFRKAFVGLLGAPADLAPTEEEMEAVNAFTRSLRAPANPEQNYRRILDDSIYPFAPDGVSASAVQGQQLFRTVPNFNGNTCADCHTQVTGSNGNMLFEVGSFVPRVQEVEVAHLRQLRHKGTETVMLNIPVPGGDPIEREVNENGFGATHDGFFASAFRFIFDTQPFKDAFSDAELRHLFAFVWQFDQGIAPGAHWATWYRPGSPPKVAKDIEKILLAGADAGWLDLVVFGRFPDGPTLREARWLYVPDPDPQLARFVSDDPVLADQSWTQFQAATQSAGARNAFMGVPLGNGFRIAFDPDADDLETGRELAEGTDPWNPDSDRDGWPDGYEVEHEAAGADPLVQDADAHDGIFPDLDVAELQFVTARVAKWHARFTEDVTYRVEYGRPGGPTLVFEKEDFVRSDTFVLTHSSPSTPIAVGNPPPLNQPDPDGQLLLSARITLTDRAGNDTAIELDDFTPLAAQAQGGMFFVHVGKMTATNASSAGDSLTATVTIEPDSHYTDPASQDYYDADGRVVFCTIAVEDPVTHQFEQAVISGGQFVFTSLPPAVPDILLWDLVPDENDPSVLVPQYTTFTALPGIPGPFVQTDPAANGSTQFTFTVTGLTTPGQKVKVAVQGIVVPVVVDVQGGMGGTEVRQLTSSLFHMQPLLTEDDDESDLVFESAELVIPFSP